MWSSWGLCNAPSGLGLVLFVGINNTSIFCLVFSQYCGGVSPLLFVGILQGIAVGIGTSNFLRAAFIVSLNSSSFCSIKNIPLNCLAIVELWFLDCPALLCFLSFFFAASDIKFHISGHTSSGREVFCFIASLLPDHVYPSGGFSIGGQILWILSMHPTILFLHPRSSNLQSVFSNITSSDVHDVLVTSMYFNGIGNDSFFGTYSLTLGTTWWQSMNSSVIAQKSSLASSSSRVESSLFLCSFGTLPDIRWMFSDAVLPPKIFTVPSATGNMKFPLLCGVYTSFALSLRAWSSDASISSNSSMSATIMSAFQIPPRVWCTTEMVFSHHKVYPEYFANSSNIP